MGRLLVPNLANIYVDYCEYIFLLLYNSNPLVFFMYVNDFFFVIFPSKISVYNFFTLLN